MEEECDDGKEEHDNRKKSAQSSLNSYLSLCLKFQLAC